MSSMNWMFLPTLALAFLSGCNPNATPPTPTPPRQTPAEVSVPKKSAPPKPEPASINEIDVSQLFALREQGKALIYDVRLPLYYKLGHIDGAILFYPKPFDKAFNREEPQMRKALSEGRSIVVYCGGADCKDSHIVGKMIAERGIPVSVYPGGWAEWKEISIE